MATLILSAAGAAIGGAAGGTFLGLSAAVIGQAAGATVGGLIDQRLFGRGARTVHTGRLDTIRVQGSAEGTPVARVYGKMRVPGHVIWASRFNEIRSETNIGGKNSGPTVLSYSYTVSMAVALCEGEILRVGRVWADGNEVSLDQFTTRLYRGTDDQIPDDLMEAIEGAGQIPAYRGLAYLVFEDLDLAPYGNRIPQFNFEVFRRASGPATFTDPDPETGEVVNISPDPYEVMRAVAMIPGSGEYALASTPVNYDYGKGVQPFANVNNASGRADLEVSLDNLSTEVPNISSVSLVVSWFGDDLRCSSCTITPRVEQNEFDGAQMPWTVSGLTRAGALTVSDIDGRPAYGGTPSDQSVVEAIAAIHAQGNDVLYYPFILMDIPAENTLTDPWTGANSQPSYPWRGRITLDLAPQVAGTTNKTIAADADVAAFFGTVQASDFAIVDDAIVYSGPNEWSFRRFILHQAWLCKLAGGVAAFCIGSEMRSLTQIRSSATYFPAVHAFKALAADVRGVLGPDTKISYAADWSEYFGYQTGEVSGEFFFHLDPLWSDPNIDFIGIDNYMPLSDWRDGTGHLDAGQGSIYNLGYLQGNVAGGEGYDWFYASQADRDAQIRTPIEDVQYGEHFVFRYKDILNWWSRGHFDRPGGVRNAIGTSWQPSSKPIWFTELGCAAIDKATNQPNVFLDVKSSESALPYYSSNQRDDFIQYRYLQAHYGYWADPTNNPASDVYGAPMVDISRIYIWTWDARPWPDFPDKLDVWSDGTNHERGHWLTGRTGLASLAAIVAEISERSGFSDYDVGGLYGAVQGYGIMQPETARQSLQPLMLSHGFDAVESDGRIEFRSRSGVAQADVSEDALSGDGAAAIRFDRNQEVQAANRVQVNYYQADKDYQRGAAAASVPEAGAREVEISDLPVALSAAEGAAVATRWLAESALAQDEVRFSLPLSYLFLTPGDVIRLTYGGRVALYRIDRIDDLGVRELHCTRIEAGIYDPGRAYPRLTGKPSYTLPGPVHIEFMDLPLVTGTELPHAPHIAVAGTPWTGRVAIYTSGTDSGYTQTGEIFQPSVVGTLIDPLYERCHGLWAWNAAVRLTVPSGELVARSEEEVLGGANLAALRPPGAEHWELIQFQHAMLSGANEYQINGMLRGQFGTAAFMPNVHPPGTDFVLLDGSAVQPALNEATRGLDQNYRIGPASRPYDDPSYAHFVEAFEGVGLRPYAPAHVMVNPLSGGDLYISWIRQTRIGGDSWLGLDVPLSELSEQYLMRVEQGGNLIREETLPTPAFLYTAADIALDGISAPFDIAVAQISETYGPGPFKRMTYNG